MDTTRCSSVAPVVNGQRTAASGQGTPSLISDVVGVIGTFLESQEALLRVCHTWRRGAIEQNGGRPKADAEWDWPALEQRQPAYLKLTRNGGDADLLSLSVDGTTDVLMHCLLRLDVSCKKVTDAGIENLTSLTALNNLNIPSSAWAAMKQLLE